MTVESLLSRLESVKQTGTGKWVARCPAHADKSPSLSITDTGTRTLIHCFAGCNAEAILTAAGLNWRDLYRDEWQAAKAAALAHLVKLPPVDPVALERRIIEIALSDLRAGKPLSIEDAARYELALERVKAAANG